MEESVTTETKTSEVVVKQATVSSPPPFSPIGAPSTTKPLEAAWNRVIQGIIYALVFLLPLLFTPWTFEPLEFSKQMLLFILTSAALIAWLLKLLVLRSWRLVKTPLDLPIGVFLLIYLLASLFSVDRIASFMGFYGSFSGNFFQMLFLVLFYYLVVNNFRTRGQLKRLYSFFSFSVFLSLLYIILQFFGWFVLPFDFARAQGFNTIGGLLTISIYSSVAVILSLGTKSTSWFSFGTGRLWRILTIIAAFVVLLTINFLYAWAGLLVGLLLYLIFQVGLSRNFTLKDLVTPLVLVILVVSFLVIQVVFPFISLRSIFSFNLPVEVRLDYQTSSAVLKGVVSNRPILGLGPNTFQNAFSKYRAQNFNLSPFWNVRFDKAPSEAAEYLVGTGILGLLAFEVLSLIFLVYGVFFLLRKKDQETWDLALASFAGLGVLWFAHWFFFFTTVIAFSFWLLLGIFMAVTRIAEGEKVKIFEFSFATSPRNTVSVVSAVSLGLVLVIVFLFFAAAVYASDIFYRKGLRAGANIETYDLAQANLEQAIRLNRFRPDYYLTYGEFLFLRINQELAKSDPNLGQIQSWLGASINTSRAAVDLSPANWTAWERLANLYTFARPLVAGVDRFIIESLTRATENDTRNPILYTELGQVYRLAARRLDPAILGKGLDTDADGLSDEQEQVLGSDPADPDTNGNNILDGNEVLGGLNPAGTGGLSDSFLAQYIKTDQESLLKAVEAFKKAIELKEDYAAAYYQLALTYEQAGKLGDAVATMEQVLQRYPTNIALKFELGRMYFNNSQTEEAAVQFQQIAALVPNHSNAIFSLALSYERLASSAGGTQQTLYLKRALDNYRRVSELNPDNEALKNKIRELEQLLLQQQAAPPAK